MKEVEFERKVQDLRNKEYLDLKKKQKEEYSKKQEYVTGLRSQIENKKAEVYSSREEFLRDREMVNQVVEKIIQEEMRFYLVFYTNEKTN